MFAASGKGKLLGFAKVYQDEDEDEKPQLRQQKEENGFSQDADENKYRKDTRKLTTWMAVVVLGWLLGLFVLVVVMDRKLPTALTIADLPDHPDSFIEERARHQLRSLTSIGARPTGSYENEVLAVQLLERELAGIASRAQPIHKLTVELQKPRGSFNLKFVDGLTHSYRCVPDSKSMRDWFECKICRNIQNVVAKLESNGGTNHALLVNCHFDSVPQSPGERRQECFACQRVFKDVVCGFPFSQHPFMSCVDHQ